MSNESDNYRSAAIRSGSKKRSIMALIFFSAFSAQKTHVKSLIHLTPCHPMTSYWHVSYVQSAIPDIDQNKAAPDTIRG